LKILYFVGEFPKLSETFILNQITGLIDNGHKVIIIAKKKENYSRVQEDVIKYNLMSKVVYYDTGKNKLHKLINFIFALLKYYTITINKKEKRPSIKTIIKYPHIIFIYSLIAKYNLSNFNVIMAHFGPNGCLASVLKKLGWINGKLFVAFHGYDMTNYLKKKGNNAYSDLFETKCLLLPISAFWQSSLIKLGAKPEQVIVHHMGTNLDKFDFCPARYSKKEVKIITVARFVEKKGLKYGILSVSELLKKGYNIKYIIIGGGPLEIELRNIVIKNSLSNNVEFLGWRTQNELLSLIKKSQIVMLPSVTANDGDMEGIPVILMEAMAMGKIVISTYHSGIPELITNNTDGYLVHEKNTIELSQTIINIINNHKKWIEIGENARNKVEIEFNIRRLNNKLLKLFQEKIK
jgi:colanic acid/amylovoran biosynthesis glycosyltransferase